MSQYPCLFKKKLKYQKARLNLVNIPTDHLNIQLLSTLWKLSQISVKCSTYETTDSIEEDLTDIHKMGQWLPNISKGFLKDRCTHIFFFPAVHSPLE